MSENGNGNGGPRRVPWAKVPMGPGLLAGLSPRELRVLMALISFQGANACCWPLREDICRRADYEPTPSNLRETSRAMQSLQRKGRVFVIQQGRGMPNQYTVRPFTPETEDAAHRESRDAAAGVCDSNTVGGVGVCPEHTPEHSGVCDSHSLGCTNHALRGVPRAHFPKDTRPIQDQNKKTPHHQPVVAEGEYPDRPEFLEAREAVVDFLRERPEAERRAVGRLFAKAVEEHDLVPVRNCLKELEGALYSGAPITNAVAYFGTVLARHVEAWRKERAAEAAREAEAEERRLVKAQADEESIVAQARSEELRVVFDGLGRCVRDEVVAEALARLSGFPAQTGREGLKRGKPHPLFVCFLGEEIRAVMAARGLVPEQAHGPPAAAMA